jgi:hypothetical protein
MQDQRNLLRESVANLRARFLVAGLRHFDHMPDETTLAALEQTAGWKRWGETGMGNEGMIEKLVHPRTGTHLCQRDGSEQEWRDLHQDLKTALLSKASGPGVSPS